MSNNSSSRAVKGFGICYNTMSENDAKLVSLMFTRMSKTFYTNLEEMTLIEARRKTTAI